jgi:hypothetical protein
MNRNGLIFLVEALNLIYSCMFDRCCYDAAMISLPLRHQRHLLPGLALHNNLAYPSSSPPVGQSRNVILA